MIEVSSNIQSIIDKLDVIYMSQLPYAMSKSINKVKNEVYQAIVKDIESSMKQNRKSAWYKAGSRIGLKDRYASKRNLEAKIFSRAPWIHYHQEGGERKPHQNDFFPVPSMHLVRRGNKRIKIPSYALKKSAKRPTRLTTPKRSFIVKRTSGQQYLMQRYGRKGKGKVRTLAYIVPSVRLKKSLQYDRIAQLIIKRRFKKYFQEALSNAINTMK